LVIPIREVRLQVVALCSYSKVGISGRIPRRPERHDKRVIAHQRMEVSLMCKSNSEKGVSKGGVCLEKTAWAEHQSVNGSIT
jgi:hypothetical protein